MKRIGRFPLAALTLIAVWSLGPMCRGTEKAYAQVDTVYQLTYFDVATAFRPSVGGYGGAGHSGGTGDALLRIVNDGVTGAGAAGDVCANIYVFNDTQELQECCACPLTPNSLITFSVINDLTSNPFNPAESLSAGVIKIVGSTACVAGGAGPYIIVPGLHEWLNHTETMASNQASFTPPYGFITSTSVADVQGAELSAAESDALQAQCTIIQEADKVGSATLGICKCGLGD